MSFAIQDYDEDVHGKEAFNLHQHDRARLNVTHGFVKQRKDGCGQGWIGL